LNGDKNGNYREKWQKEDIIMIQTEKEEAL